MAKRLAKKKTKRPEPASVNGDEATIEDVDYDETVEVGYDGDRPTLNVAGSSVNIPDTLPVLPLRNLVVFPGTVMPLNIGRPKSKALLEEVMSGDPKMIAVVAQRDAEDEDPEEGDLHAIGTVCMILKLFRLPDGNQSIIVHGHNRFRLHALAQTEPFHVGHLEPLQDQDPEDAESMALVSGIREQAKRLIELSPNTPDEAQQLLDNI
ncbi:MAG: LON peptidase substrate-binding domain-containing protein, partial [Planctomycetota bacterium]